MKLARFASIPAGDAHAFVKRLRRCNGLVISFGSRSDICFCKRLP